MHKRDNIKHIHAVLHRGVEKATKKRHGPHTQDTSCLAREESYKVTVSVFAKILMGRLININFWSAGDDLYW